MLRSLERSEKGWSPSAYWKEVIALPGELVVREHDGGVQSQPSASTTTLPGAYHVTLRVNGISPMQSPMLPERITGSPSLALLT